MTDTPQSDSNIKVNYATLLPFPLWKDTVEGWMKEDIPSFDYGGSVVGDALKTAYLYCKAKGVVCGEPFVNEIFTRLKCTVEWKHHDGEELDPKDGKIVVAIVRGPARQILAGERTALNLMARAAGIATQTRKVAKIVKEQKWTGNVAATRKTTPGFRLVEKYAVLVGGCDSHRMDLSSMIMLKDNHINAAGSITNAVKKAKLVGGFSMKVEVEAGDFESADEACTAGADVVMLDNFNPTSIIPVAKKLREKHGNKVILEASGGITPETVSQYMNEYIDIISMGSLIQGVSHIDFSLKIEK